ncbi:50S ribosomal protein L23 [Litorilinea aerophila]|uniref:Large ribosomal subunit protein uL23 n=1 Tax=Litorilinea aerophila TaxID=1204385 RepID=A0A540VJI6_9CHLR|nr:50S ribosomal protein L23 [Litorilinea aerophila]MCC9075913.1 50S ribosomal protein L23 [Litorilinea aerophila]OUC08862.1 50S ribosomal protein L23 [Litorilinea aerophila]GIV78729.1 MAG: 50S ribosomal protein L23 [Litorilinea sp.]
MHVYEVIRRPIITEKSMIAAEDENKYVFEVDMRANKLQVKDAVEVAFGVTVEDVRIAVMPAKTRRRGRRVMIRKPKWKKAIVTLAPGESIQLFEGV